MACFCACILKVLSSHLYQSPRQSESLSLLSIRHNVHASCAASHLSPCTPCFHLHAQGAAFDSPPTSVVWWGSSPVMAECLDMGWWPMPPPLTALDPWPPQWQMLRLCCKPWLGMTHWTQPAAASRWGFGSGCSCRMCTLDKCESSVLEECPGLESMISLRGFTVSLPLHLMIASLPNSSSLDSAHDSATGRLYLYYGESTVWGPEHVTK